MSSPYDVSDKILLRAFGLKMNCQDMMIRVHEQKPRKENFEPRERDHSCLGKLPVELTHLVLEYLDFRSLDAYRATCFTSHARVESFSPYKEIMKYSPDTLRVLKETDLSSHFTAVQLCEALRSERCGNCENFGPFLSIITCQRCCVNCSELRLRSPFQIMPQEQAISLLAGVRKSLGIGEILEDKLRVMKSIPGRYKNVHHSESMLLVSLQQMLELLSDLNYDPSWELSRPHTDFRYWESEDEETWEECRDDAVSAMWDKIKRSRSPWLAAVPFPSVDQASKVIENGLLCAACDEAYRCFDLFNTRRARRFHRVNVSLQVRLQLYNVPAYAFHFVNSIDRSRTHYTKPGLLQHFEECEQLQVIKDGTITSRLERRYVRELFSALPFHDDWPEPEISYSTDLFDL